MLAAASDHRGCRLPIIGSGTFSTFAVGRHCFASSGSRWDPAAMPHDHVDEYLQAAKLAGALLAAPAVAERWSGPSALVDWSVAGLAGHLARSVFTVETALSATVDPGEQLINAVTYYARVPDEDLQPASEVSTHIRARGLESAGPGTRIWSPDTKRA